MKHIYYSIIAVVLWMVFPITLPGAQRTVATKDIRWAEFLRQHDLVWSEITSDYYAGAIMGNGLLGTNIYKDDRDSTAYRFHVGRVDVTEGRMPADKTRYRNLYDGARLPIGHFLMKPVGKVNAEQMRLSLWDAVTTGRLVTDQGEIAFKSYVHATQDLIVLETETKGAESGWQWKWIPLKAISPRLLKGMKDYSPEYLAHPNPEVKMSEREGYHLSVQNLYGGKTYVVAWKEVRTGNRCRLMVTISQEDTEQKAIDRAKLTLERAMNTKPARLERTHTDWWHGYYPSSFLTLGDARLESFYWIQQYKFACLTRPDKFVIDLQGPWAMQVTPWPAIWMNLNTQLTYSPLFTANRADLSLPLWKGLNDNLQNLIDNAPESWRHDAACMGRSTSYHFYSPLNPRGENKMVYETGNLTWLLFYYYQYCTWTGNEQELTEKLFPLLKRSIAYYEHIREMRTDGRYHLPETASPEYATAKDCNYDLSLLRWGLNTLLDLNERYGLKDAKQADWKDFLSRLMDYPTDPEKGYMIGEGVNMTSSHRHYSHLLMIYPLYQVNWDQVENRDLIAKSIAHWQSMPQWLQGYSFTGSSAMYSMMGDGDRAVAQLQKLLGRYIQPNTLYKETGPVIETPLAGGASIQDLYLQSWGDKVRVFPAVPKTWKEASFINLRAEGAFLVSATRKEGKTVFIQVESEKGGLCRLQTGMDMDAWEVVQARNGKAVDYRVVDKTCGLVELTTTPGDVIQLKLKSAKDIAPVPVRHDPERCNFYGDAR